MSNEILEFLARVEDPDEKEMNTRARLSDSELEKLRSEYPGVPSDFLSYLGSVGSGAFRECRYAVYGYLSTIDEMLGEGVFELEEPDVKVLLFGDSFSGDWGAFLPDEDWRVADVWHDSGEIYRLDQTFDEYIRKRMGMGPNGKDLHNH